MVLCRQCPEPHSSKRRTYLTMQTRISLILSTLVALATAYILPGVTLTGFVPALVVAIILGVLNTLIFPILLVFTIPLNVMTLGLFTFVIMGFIVWLTSLIVPGFHVQILAGACFLGYLLPSSTSLSAKSSKSLLKALTSSALFRINGNKLSVKEFSFLKKG